jgi:hypothetical protein
VKDGWMGALLGVTSALVTALAGRNRWAVGLTLLTGLGMTYAVVRWLASRPYSGSVRIGPIESRAARLRPKKSPRLTSLRILGVVDGHDAVSHPIPHRPPPARSAPRPVWTRRPAATAVGRTRRTSGTSC